MEAHNSNSELHSPRLGAADSQRFVNDTATVRRAISGGGAHGQECTSSDRNMDGGEQRASLTVAPAGCSVLDAGKAAEVNASLARVIGTEKRKRGRPPRGQAAVKLLPPKRKKEEDEEEDVCFICFDGGSLVLCDRKGCPKAYHPTCIKRDESFFRSKAKWNCGWHICSVCHKSSHYMCYTCTYSLCKSCFRNADYFCVRGCKGFCSTCMRFILLVENKDEANKETVQVDFDDKTSWEYLFKVYWILLKEKLSLTSNELIQAKNPRKEAVATQSKLQLASAHLYANDSKGVIGQSSEYIELKNHKEIEDLSKKDSLFPENLNIAKQNYAHLCANDTPSEHVELKNDKEMKELSKKYSLIPGDYNVSKLDNAHHYENDIQSVIGKSSEHAELKTHKEIEELFMGGSLIPESSNIVHLDNTHFYANNSKDVIGKSSEHLELKNHEERKELGMEGLIPVKQNNAKSDSAHLFANDSEGVTGKSVGHVELKNNQGKEELDKDDSLILDNPDIAKSKNACIGISNESLGLTNPDEPQSEVNDSAVKAYPEWGTKELLEFVAYVKNGDMSPLSQFDVQELLLDYIKRNNLRDPHKKSEILCDLKLKNLFGKSRLGHIEMLKLIEFHFLINDSTQKNAFIPAGIVGSSSDHLEADLTNSNSSLRNKNKRRKPCKKGEEKAPQNSLDEYAAIDAHNINLIYLRRGLMENIFEDGEKFHEEVIGSIVRIKVSAVDQKLDMFRLVHVVGTCRGATPYKIGEKTTNIMLEVLNLDKREAVSIHTLSDQEFSEDECRRLHQSIKCGLVKPMTVGEIQKKAMELRPVKLSDTLESEILRLNHLRDRASENGRKKDLRECIAKLQRLKTAEERHRRMLEIPEVHADPKMNPNYEAEDVGPTSDKKQDENLRQRNIRFDKVNESKQTHPPIKKAKAGGAVIALMAPHRTNEKQNTSGVHISGKRLNQTSTCSSVISNQHVDQAAVRRGSETSIPSHSIANSTLPPLDSDGTEKLWHYRDPSGTIQGPFSMTQLRRWSKTGLFPPHLRVWTRDEHNESILLRDALHGQSHTPPQVRDIHGESHMPPQIPDIRWPASSNGTSVKESREKDSHDDNAVHLNADLSSRPSLQCLNLLHEDSLSSDKPQEYSSMPPPHSSSSEGQQMEVGQQEPCSDTMSHHPTDTIEHEMQCNGQSFMDQLFGENWGSLDPLPITDSEDIGPPSPHFVQATSKSVDSPPEQDGRANNLSDLPSPTPKKSNYESWEVQAAKELLSLSSDIPFHQRSSPPPRASSEHSPSTIPVQDQAGPPQSTTVCSLVLDGWDPGLVSVPSSLKPPDATHSSLPHPNVIEFSTLAEESVSDLLAEVDAMESSQAQSGVGSSSPTSAMRCSVELMLWSKSDDCFNSIEEMNASAPDPTTKNDAYSSSTMDIQLRAANEMVPTAAFDPVSRRSNGHSSTSSAGETKSSDIAFDCRMSSSVALGVGQSRGSEAGVPSWAVANPGGNMSYGGASQSDPQQGYTNTEARQAWRNNPNMKRSGFDGGNVTLDNYSQRRQYSAERLFPPGPKDHWTGQGGYPGGGSGGRTSRPTTWNNRQSVPGGGGGYSRPPPHKSHRVCKFYESGRCKKGASCDYFHP